MFKRLTAFLFALGLMIAAGTGTSEAASICKGMSSSKCGGTNACYWVKGYTTKKGSNVKAHCRAKPNGGAAKATTKKSSAKKASASDSSTSSSSSSSTAKKVSTKKAVSAKDAPKAKAKDAKKKTTKKKATTKKKSKDKKKTKKKKTQPSS